MHFTRLWFLHLNFHTVNSQLGFSNWQKTCMSNFLPVLTHVFLLKFSSQMPLYKGCFAHTSISHQHQLKVENTGSIQAFDKAVWRTFFAKDKLESMDIWQQQTSHEIHLEHSHHFFALSLSHCVFNLLVNLNSGKENPRPLKHRMVYIHRICQILLHELIYNPDLDSLTVAVWI